MKKFVFIFSLLIFAVLLSPSPIFAAKKVDYVDTKVFKGSNQAWGTSVKVDGLNNIYVTGAFDNTADFDFTGETDIHISNGGNDIFLTKINPDGTYGYTITFGSTGHEDVQSIAFDSFNNIYISGSFRNTVDFDFTGGTDNHTSIGDRDVFVVKVNLNGTYGWTKTFGGTDWDGASLSIDSSNNIYLSGWYYNLVDFDFTNGTDNHTSNGGSDAFITKINSDGTYGWTNTFGGTGDDWILTNRLDSLNNIYVTGWFENTVDFNFTGEIDNHSSNGSYDIFLTKINSDGTYAYTKTFGGIGGDGGNVLSLDSSNNIFVAGSFASTVDFDFTVGIDNKTANGSQGEFLTKINSDGTYGHTKIFSNVSGLGIYSIGIDNSDNLYLSGWFYATLDFDPGVGVINRTQTGSYYDGFVVSLSKNGDYRWVKTYITNLGYDVRDINIVNNKLYATGIFRGTTNFNPDGLSNTITENNWSGYLTSYKLYTPSLTVAESSETTSIVPNVSTDTITVKLDAEPDSNVTVTLGSNDGSLVYSPSSLTFTSANYATPQTVTISSNTPVGSNTTKNMTFILTSSDTDYNGLSVTPLSVGVLVDNSDITAPSKVVITNLGNISNVPNKDILRYYFTSQTPVIKGTSEANSTVYFVVNGHTYSTIAGSDGKFSITLSNPSLERNKNVIVYYAKDSYFNKSTERTLELTVGEENFPSQSSSSSSSSSESSMTSSSSSSSSSSTSSVSSSSSSSNTSSVEIILTTKEITIKDENGNILPNAKVTINGKTYTTDSKGKVKAEVAGVYIIEYDKGGVRYSSTIKPSENIVTLKAQTTNILPYIALCIVSMLVIGLIALMIRRRKKSE